MSQPAASDKPTETSNDPNAAPAALSVPEVQLERVTTRVDDSTAQAASETAVTDGDASEATDEKPLPASPSAKERYSKAMLKDITAKFDKIVGKSKAAKEEDETKLVNHDRTEEADSTPTKQGEEAKVDATTADADKEDHKMLSSLQKLREKISTTFSKDASHDSAPAQPKGEAQSATEQPTNEATSDPVDTTATTLEREAEETDEVKQEKRSTVAAASKALSNVKRRMSVLIKSSHDEVELKDEQEHSKASSQLDHRPEDLPAVPEATASDASNVDANGKPVNDSKNRFLNGFRQMLSHSLAKTPEDDKKTEEAGPKEQEEPTGRADTLASLPAISIEEASIAEGEAATPKKSVRRLSANVLGGVKRIISEQLASSSNGTKDKEITEKKENAEATSSTEPTPNAQATESATPSDAPATPEVSPKKAKLSLKSLPSTLVETIGIRKASRSASQAEEIEKPAEQDAAAPSTPEQGGADASPPEQQGGEASSPSKEGSGLGRLRSMLSRSPSRTPDATPEAVADAPAESEVPSSPSPKFWQLGKKRRDSKQVQVAEELVPTAATEDAVPACATAEPVPAESNVAGAAVEQAEDLKQYVPELESAPKAPNSSADASFHTAA